MIKAMRTAIVLLALTLSAVAYGSGGGAHWTYDGHSGPENWGTLSHEYAACGEGREQSPIDIRDAKPDGLPPIEARYKVTPLDIINNGHTIQVNYETNSHAVLAGHDYKLPANTRSMAIVLPWSSTSCTRTMPESWLSSD
jgi:carbonic anhydrase